MHFITGIHREFWFLRSHHLVAVSAVLSLRFHIRSCNKGPEPFPDPADLRPVLYAYLRSSRGTFRAGVMVCGFSLRTIHYSSRSLSVLPSSDHIVDDFGAGAAIDTFHHSFAFACLAASLTGSSALPGLTFVFGSASTAAECYNGI